MELREAIELELARWAEPVVEPVVFGSADPRVIAASFEQLCKTHLGAEIADCSFYRASVGCVAGVTLDDGRHLVIKAHQPTASRARLSACHAVQRMLSQRGFPCPRPVLQPTPLATELTSLATAEQFLDRGERRDAHDPPTRRIMAAGLQELISLADPEHVPEGLHGAWYTALGSRLWPRPHNALFDFEATAAGAEWIDDIARRARQVPVMGKQPVIAHFDWRAEHLRFDGHGISAVHDWDSLHLEREPIAVGAAAHAFTAQFDREDIPPAPSADEVLCFIEDYQLARGGPFSPPELSSAKASCAYSIAYTARCEHARPDPHPRPFGALLRVAAESLLEGVSGR